MRFSIFINNNKVVKYKTAGSFGRRMKFVFLYRFVGTSWRAYILHNPSYKFRSENFIDTHRNYDAEKKQHYVCWTDCITKFSDILKVSKLWADKTARYIEFGELF